jgi:CHAT domain-containing protein/tetratricopeptide (TPR) repeat protein
VLCAILRRFDRHLLDALGQGDHQASITALLASDRVQPLPDAPGAFQLRDDLQAAILAQLRADHPGGELALHERAYAYFLNEMNRPTSPERRLAEQCCFHHLGALRLLLTERRQWQRIEQQIAAIRGVRLDQVRHVHLLSLYESYVAIRTNHYESGETALNALLSQDGVDPDVRMRGLNFLAQSHWFQAHYDQALALYQDAYTLAESIGDLTYQAFALLNMSMIYHEIGYYDQALKLSMESLELFRRLGDIEHEAHALYEVGKNAVQLGRWHDAQHYYQQATARYEQLGVVAQQANLYCLLGMLHHALGDVDASEAAYLRGLEIGQSLEHGDPAVTMDGWLLLGLLYQTQERWPQALEAYGQAASLAQHLRNVHSLALAYYRRGDVFRALGQSDAATTAYREAIEQVEALRGIIEGEEIKIGLLGATQQIYESMILLCLDRASLEEAYNYVERARSRAFLDMLAKRSPDLYAALNQPVATLAEVQAQLPVDAVLIEYYTTGVLPPGEHLLNKLSMVNKGLLKHLIRPPKIVIFALTRERFVVEEAQLDPNMLQPDVAEVQPGRRWLQERKLRMLYDQLIDPVAELLEGCGQVFIIPHGPLHSIPFMALCAPDGRYLLDIAGSGVALAPSATVLLRNCLARSQLTEGTMLALGYNDPRVGLRHAESEACAIARTMGGTAWIGSAPKSMELPAVAGSIRWLHIAGHAAYLPHDPLGSYLSLGDNDMLSARMVMRDLRLRAELVSLSTCMSGLNQIVPGDELLGLLRAWFYAGAATVVCTLWEASDIVARLLMERFYEALQRGSTAGIAFRDAVAAVRRITGRELAETFARWVHEDETHTLSDVLPMIPLEDYDTYPYARPVTWAPFMLIGRP